MTTGQLRVRLAVALGLPAAACSAPPPKPTPPSNVARDTSKFACAVDQVHEHVCGIPEAGWASMKAGASGRYASCPADAEALGSFDEATMIDAMRIGAHHPSLGTFHYDPVHTVEFAEQNGDIASGVVRCCYDRCQPLTIAEPRKGVPAGWNEFEVCVPKPERASHPAAKAPVCPEALKLRVEAFYPPDPLDDAPFARIEGDQCCYQVATAHKCGPGQRQTAQGCFRHAVGGRPLRDGDAIVVAPAMARDDWRAAIRVGARDGERAAAWRRAAAFEHASVAAFSRLAIELLAVGAPPELVDDVHVAARDEIRHARVCYGLASAYGGEDVGPAALPVAMPRVLDLSGLAVECFRDGCVDETIAAVEAEELITGDLDDDQRAALRAIADDEARHAELSYRIVAWAMREGGEPVRARIAQELAMIAGEGSDGLRRRVVDDVVIPTTTRMLAV